MSTDGIALLHLGALDDPETVHPNLAPLSDDGSWLLPLFVAFDLLATDPPKLARYLQDILGRDLEAHEDARGVFVFPDVPHTASSYDALVAELAAKGFWAREEPPPEPPVDEPAAMEELTRAVVGAIGGAAAQTAAAKTAAAKGVPSDERAEAARRYDALAAELDAAAAHLRSTARHFRDGDVPRASAHRVAADGHLVQVRQELDALAVLQARKAGR